MSAGAGSALGLKDFIHRSQVLHLYREFLRKVQQAPKDSQGIDYEAIVGMAFNSSFIATRRQSDLIERPSDRVVTPLSLTFCDLQESSKPRYD